MATSSNQLAAPSSSSSTTCWDVFLSFYGKDTRKNFTSHLYCALVRAGILTFKDDPELHKGEEISSGVLNAIRSSKIFVVVLSENYAFSRWCLDELVEIISCKRTGGHVVIPVFYYVDPSNLRYQKGSFGEALAYHKKRYTVNLIDKWKSALAEIAELSGYHLKMDANENESDIVQEIVENLTPLISTRDLHHEEYLVGIDSSVEEIYRKLCMESNDVRAIGICGMGGIGKTTAAKAFYNKYFNIFDISCFVDDLKQHSERGSYLLPLLQQLSIKLFGRTDNKVHDVKSGVRQLKQFLCNKKALIVVDDLNQSTCSELLVRVCNLFSSGSRIIFTTRDAYLAKQLKEDVSEVDIYMMRELNQVDSLELFSYHAFRKPTPPESFKELSVSFVTYAVGLPLALKVLGSSLLGRTDVSFWKEKLVKVQEIGENDIQQILRLSYDELGDETLKAIFLDIAFFFVGGDKDEAVHVFQSCGFFPNVGIPILEERCLLTVDENNNFQMHNLIQRMGNEVIREESKHGNCRRLYLCGGDACMALQNLEGIQKIEGLIIDQTKSLKRHFNAKILERMPNLRLLEIIGAHDVEGDFKNVLLELRCIRWSHCTWKRLPSSFHPPKLVSLHIPCSDLKTLWKDVEVMTCLKCLYARLGSSSVSKSSSPFSSLFRFMFGGIVKPLTTITQFSQLKRSVSNGGYGSNLSINGEDYDELDQGGVTHHSPTQVLKNFSEIKILRIELPSGELGIDDGVLLKWRADFGSTLDNCVILGASSVVNCKALDNSGGNSSSEDDNGSIRESFYTDGGLKLRVKWTISSLIAASARHYLLQPNICEHKTLDRLVLTDTDGQGVLRMSKDQLEESRVKPLSASSASKRTLVPALNMRLWYAPQLELPDGSVLKGATLVAIRPSEQTVVKREVADGSWVCSAFEEPYQTAAKMLIKRRTYCLEMDSF